VLAFLGFSGAMTAVSKFVPIPAGVGFLCWVGILVTKQAFMRRDDSLDYSAAVVVRVLLLLLLLLQVLLLLFLLLLLLLLLLLSVTHRSTPHSCTDSLTWPQTHSGTHSLTPTRDTHCKRRDLRFH
jgi:hypothetical protein